MSFPRYPAYKDSGVEWLGEVPAHWDVLALKRVASISYGIGEPPQYRPDGIPLIRATNIHNGHIYESGLVFVDPEDIPEKRIFWLQAGDIIVVRSGAYTGDSATILEKHCPAIAGFDMVLRPQYCDPAFLQFSLLSFYLKEQQIDLEKMRAAQPHLNAEELGSCVLIHPELAEQKSIAAFLSTETAKIDALIAEQEHLIALLKEKRQAVISHAVTKGLNPDVPMKDSGVEWLGQVPAHWRSLRVKNIVPVIEQGWSPEAVDRQTETGEWGVLKAGCVNGGVFRETEHKTLPPETQIPIHLAVKPGDILMSRASGSVDLIGSVALVDRCDANIIMSDKIFRIIIDENASIKKFFGKVMSSSIVRTQIIQAISGAEGLANNIGKGEIREFQLVMPPMQEQLEISEYLDRMSQDLNQLIAESDRSIRLLQERRSALISAAVTGKIDVRGLAVPSEVAA